MFETSVHSFSPEITSKRIKKTLESTKCLTSSN